MCVGRGRAREKGLCCSSCTPCLWRRLLPPQLLFFGHSKAFHARGLTPDMYVSWLSHCWSVRCWFPIAGLCFAGFSCLLVCVLLVSHCWSVLCWFFMPAGLCVFAQTATSCLGATKQPIPSFGHERCSGIQHGDVSDNVSLIADVPKVRAPPRAGFPTLPFVHADLHTPKAHLSVVDSLSQPSSRYAHIVLPCALSSKCTKPKFSRPNCCSKYPGLSFFDVKPKGFCCTVKALIGQAIFLQLQYTQNLSLVLCRNL